MDQLNGLPHDPPKPAPLQGSSTQRRPTAHSRDVTANGDLTNSVRDTARTTYLVTTDGDEERCDTPEEVSRIVAQYQLEHPDDPNRSRISVARRSRGTDERLPAQQFLPEQIP
jgi:hypothetical protein